MGRLTGRAEAPWECGMCQRQYSVCDRITARRERADANDVVVIWGGEEKNKKKIPNRKHSACG